MAPDEPARRTVEVEALARWNHPTLDTLGPMAFLDLAEDAGLDLQLGDAVLRSLAAVLHQRIRSQDIVGRYGGEEFLVVLPETTLLGARRLATELCKAVAAHAFVHEGQQIAQTVSIGVFGGLLEPGDSWDVLIHAADSALYDAKHSGRNRVEETPVLPRANGEGSHPETFPASLS